MVVFIVGNFFKFNFNCVGSGVNLKFLGGFKVSYWFSIIVDLLEVKLRNDRGFISVGGVCLFSY